MPPRASVIIPNLDCTLAGQAVESVLRQDAATDLEVLVVGRDRPGVVPDHPQVTLIRTPSPVPPAAARNLGIERASGERLLFLDADCRAAEGWASHLLSALQEAQVAGGAVRFSLDGNRWAVADNIASFSELLEDRPAERNPRQPLGTLNLAVTREACRRVGPFDEQLPTSEDHDWYFRARDIALVTLFEPRAVVDHMPVRTSKQELLEHARWYGRHFHAFRAKHPEAFAQGPTWRTRRRLAWWAPVKSVLATVAIFRRHPMLRPAWRCFPRIVLFKLTWYRAVLAAWPRG